MTGPVTGPMTGPMTGPAAETGRGIPYGGDYTPEQWPRDVWEQDWKAFGEASIDTVTLGVFAWSMIQPDERTYDFSRLDQIVEEAVAHGARIVLATATGAMPPWLARDHPDACRTDFEGRVHVYGQRHNHCPSSPAFRRLSRALAGRIAERYAGTPGLVAWHVGNEYGGACYCPRCTLAFRVWLQQRYGTLERLNAAWNTTFWSHLFTDWDQVVAPSALSEHWQGPRRTAFQGITLDYRRFMSDALLRNYLDERDAIREHDASTPATTNFMGLYEPIDYHRWAPHLDLASWDNYPPGPREHARMAMTHDMMRGLRDGAPFWLMEQTPSITASRDVNPVKRPGVMRLWSWQAVAHGADAVLFFQMRQSRGACEKYHGAVLGHSGRTDTRVFREVAQLGAELRTLGDAVVGARTRARVALLLDWDSWWTVEMTDGLNRHVSYLRTVLQYHRAAWAANAAVDVVPVTADLEGYDVVLAPVLHVVTPELVERLRTAAARGASVVSTFYAGRADESANAWLADAPGLLARLFGVRAEETDSGEPGVVNPVVLGAHDAPTGGPPPVVSDASLVFELLVCEGAQVEGTYTADFYAGTPAVTRHAVGEGEGWYVGTALDDEGVAWVVGRALARHDLVGPYADVPDLELAVRELDGVRTAFLLHHGLEPVDVRAHASGTDLLTGRRIVRGDPLHLAPAAVVVMRLDGPAGPRAGHGEEGEG